MTVDTYWEITIARFDLKKVNRQRKLVTSPYSHFSFAAKRYPSNSLSSGASVGLSNSMRYPSGSLSGTTQRRLPTNGSSSEPADWISTKAQEAVSACDARQTAPHSLSRACRRIAFQTQTILTSRLLLTSRLAYLVSFGSSVRYFGARFMPFLMNAPCGANKPVTYTSLARTENSL